MQKSKIRKKDEKTEVANLGGNKRKDDKKHGKTLFEEWTRYKGQNEIYKTPD